MLKQTLAMLIGVSVLSACGQKGALYIPEPGTKVITRPTTTAPDPQSQPATTAPPPADQPVDAKKGEKTPTDQPK